MAFRISRMFRSKTFTIIKWLLPFLWVKDTTIRLGVCFSLALTVLTIAINAGIPLIFKNIVTLLAVQQPSVIIMMQLMLLSYGVSWIIGQLVSLLSYVTICRALERGMQTLSLKIFEHLHTLSLRFHIEKKMGGITSAIDRAQSGFETIFWVLLLSLVPIIIEMMLIIMIVVCFYGVTYSFIFLVTMMAYLLFSSMGMNILDETQNTYNKAKTHASETLVDSLLNYETVKYFHNQKYDYERCTAILQQQEDTGMHHYYLGALIHGGQKIILGVGLAYITWKSGNEVLAGVLQVSDFVLINSYLMQFVMPLTSFGYNMRQVRKGLNDMYDIVELLNTQPEIQDVPHAVTLNAQTATVEFNHVGFTYDKQRTILNDVSFSIPTGKTVAIVGSTGAGKSTITRLLFRFYDTTQGAILFNSHDIRTLTQHSLHKAIGVVSQDTNLFNDTLYHNIAYARPTASQQEIEQVIELAHLSDFIKKLPQGYQTMVGERGFKLSGGEKQRVAIARVLLKQPTLYIFDEATSHLDNVTEREIQQNLKKIAAGKTTLIIAHRLSTITHADEIIVLDHGIIKERGTHEELLSQHGIYAGLWHRQH